MTRRAVTSVGIAVALMAGTACGGSSGADVSVSDARVSASVPASTSTTSARFSLPNAGLTASFIPVGFTPVTTALGRAVPGHVSGPAPGWTNDGQQFWNRASKQGFVMSVQHGIPASYSLGSGSGYVAISHRVSGCATFTRTEPLATPEREFAWIVGPTTTGFVGGFDMGHDELLRIADGITIDSR